MEWFEFQLIEKPYYDDRGNILASVAGRKNRPGIDEFKGGGMVYPELPGKVVQRFERGGWLLVLLDAPEGVLSALSTKKQALEYFASPRITKAYNFSDFHATRIDRDKVVGKLKVQYGLPDRIKLSDEGRMIFTSPSPEEGNRTIGG